MARRGCFSAFQQPATLKYSVYQAMVANNSRLTFTAVFVIIVSPYGLRLTTHEKIDRKGDTNHVCSIVRGNPYGD